MKIGSHNMMLIKFLQAFLQTKDDHCLVRPEFVGNITLESGTKKKKYQYIKGELSIMHDVLVEESKNDLRTLYDCKFLHYAYIPKKHINEKTLERIKETENEIQEYLTENPKIKEAIENLLDALKEVS